MAMKNPPHPGFTIKDVCLDPLGLNVTEGAKLLGIARNTFLAWSMARYSSRSAVIASRAWPEEEFQEASAHDGRGRGSRTTGLTSPP